MESMSCRVLVSAKDMNQSRGRCYGRIVTKSRRVLRFFVQVAGKSLQEVRRQKVTEQFVCCQERGYLVRWQDLTCHGARLFLRTVIKKPVNEDYICVVLGLQEGSSLPVLRGRANKRRFGRAVRLPVDSARSRVLPLPSSLGQGTASAAVLQFGSGLGSDVCGLLGQVGYLCRRVGDVGHVLVLRELIVALVGDGEEPTWVDESSLDFPMRVQVQSRGEGGAVVAMRAFRAGVARLASVYSLEDVRMFLESCKEERIHGVVLEQGVSCSGGCASPQG